MSYIFDHFNLLRFKILSWWWKQQVSPECWYPSDRLHSVVSQRTVIFSHPHENLTCHNWNKIFKTKYTYIIKNSITDLTSSLETGFVRLLSTGKILIQLQTNIDWIWVFLSKSKPVEVHLCRDIMHSDIYMYQHSEGHTAFIWRVEEFFYTEDGASRFLWNEYIPDYISEEPCSLLLQGRKLFLLWEPQTSQLKYNGKEWSRNAS